MLQERNQLKHQNTLYLALMYVSWHQKYQGHSLARQKSIWKELRQPDLEAIQGCRRPEGRFPFVFDSKDKDDELIKFQSYKVKS